MIVYRVGTVTSGGTIKNHAVREADLVRNDMVGLFQALNEFYDFENEIDFNSFIQITIKRLDEEFAPPSPNVAKAFEDLRPFLSYSTFSDESIILKILDRLKESK